MNNRSYSAVRLTSSPGAGQRSMRWMTSTASGGRAQPGPPGAASRVPTARAGKPSRTVRAGWVSRCLTHAPARTIDSGPTVLKNDGGRLDDRAPADGAAVDHGAGPDDDVVLDDQLVVGEQGAGPRSPGSARASRCARGRAS